MKRMIHRKKPVCCLAGATGLIFLLLFLALWLERLWSGSSHSLPTVVSLWQGVLFLVYFLIVCGSVCCRSMGRTRRWSGFLRYLPWAAVMALLFLLCAFSGSPSAPGWPELILSYLPQPLAAGGVVIFLAHCLCSERETPPLVDPLY